MACEPGASLNSLTVSTLDSQPPMSINTGMLSLRHLCLAALLLGLSGCTYFENKFAAMSAASKKSAKDKRIGEAKVIGVIEMVNPEQNYVLINCEQRVDIPAGTEIICQGVNGTDAKLKVSPERKGNYITADIVTGTPQLHDLVIYQVKSDGTPAQAQPQPGPLAPGPATPLTPIMQADVIPPLNTPFQPMAPVQPGALPQQPLTQQPPPFPVQAPAMPRQQPADEPAPDLSKLPPVIR